jgi:hypothetical protein
MASYVKVEVQVPSGVYVEYFHGDEMKYVCGLCGSDHGVKEFWGTQGRICNIKLRRPVEYDGHDIKLKGLKNGKKATYKVEYTNRGYWLLAALIADYSAVKNRVNALEYYVLHDDPCLYTSKLPGDIVRMIRLFIG